MTPKEKAEHLVSKYFDEVIDTENRHAKAKNCALIAVSEMIDMLERFSNYKTEYWRQVKKEIELL